MITIKNHKLEKWIDEILRRSHFSSPDQYLEARIQRDYQQVIKNKPLEGG